jgi:RNA polymerase sigma-70 factor (ECF subfamily)
LFSELYKYSYTFIKSHECAEEIVSDVFIKLWKIRLTLRDVDNLKTYLYKATKNYSLNYISKTSRIQVLTLDEMKTMATSTVLNYSPEDIYISNESMNIISRVIRELPPQCRQIFKLVREDGLKYKDVAIALNISTFTVRNQIVIATRKISNALTLNGNMLFSPS